MNDGQTALFNVRGKVKVCVFSPHKTLPSIPTVVPPSTSYPVNLKEAALDSPTFRANAIHYYEQVDGIEKWLDAYIRSTTRVCQEINNLEEALTVHFSRSVPSQASEAIIDHDYTLLALQRFAESGKDFWSSVIAYSRRLQPQIIDPISDFLRNDIRQFKDCRRAFDTSQQRYDTLLQRYAGQSKGKEASALREDAFQLHESRKAYIRSSFDFCVKAPELRANLDRLFTRITTDVWREQVSYRRGFSVTADRLESEMERIRSWSDTMECSAKIFKQELVLARKDMEEQAKTMSKPSRELEEYASSTVPFLTTRGKEAAGLSTSNENVVTEKQGWLFIRSFTGKPTRSVWNRRWCFVKDGIFGSLVLQAQGLKGAGVEETEKIGLLLCNIKPAFQEDRRFCFEIKTKDAGILLQAETQQELTSWLGVFEAAKRAAISSSTSSINNSAFAISPPNADFAASATLRTDDNHDKSSSLGIQTLDTLSRASTDVGARRAQVIPDDASTVGNPKFTSKNELVGRKGPNPGVQGLGVVGKSGASGGIQALISASHGALPLNTVPSTTLDAPLVGSLSRSLNSITYNEVNTSTSLAPRTLVNPPMSTNLSKQALAVSRQNDTMPTLPGGMMANSWGTSNWGLTGRQDEASSVSILNEDGKASDTQLLFKEQRQNEDTESSAPIHQKASSIDLDTHTSLHNLAQQASRLEQYPINYPEELRQQDAQFRIIFPDVARDEIVLLVFRATWKPNDAQEFPGRAYVTSSAIYFYSHYLGLVLVNKIPLRYVLDVQVTAGKVRDILHLHLREVEELAALSGEEIDITTFLETIWLLQRRLRYLVEASSQPKTSSNFDILKRLTEMESEPQKSPLSESWEEISLQDEFDELEIGKISSKTAPGRPREQKTVNKSEVESRKHHLPVKLTSFVPSSDMIKHFERTYELSAKSLFSVLFGDHSQVFTKFYAKRRSSNVWQSPWTKADEVIGRRTFTYTTSTSSVPSLLDSQEIQTMDDNRYYIVVDRKYPWQIPSSKILIMEIKIVITFVTKTSSTVSFWGSLQWLKRASFWKGTFTQHSLQILRDDAQDLASILNEEVNRIGNGSRHYKVAGEYGQVHIRNEVAGDIPLDLKYIPPQSRLHQYTYIEFFIHEIFKLTMGTIYAILQGFLAPTKILGDFIKVNWILMLLLGISVVSNANVTLQIARSLWHDTAALSYSANLGVQPESVMTRSITVADMYDLANFSPTELQSDPPNQCLRKFLSSHALNSENDVIGDITTAPDHLRTFEDKLKLARKRLGTYRHDVLVALSLIGKLENDILSSEWESWVWIERKRCLQAKAVLHKFPQSSHIDTESFHTLESYCTSCDIKLSNNWR